MGIFSQDKTTTNQTAYNEQTTASNRDLSGSQTQLGAGAQGNTIINQSLDERALLTEANVIGHAIDVNAASGQANLQGFQNALQVVSEHQQSAADLAAGQQGTTLGKIGVDPRTITYIVGAIVGGLVLMAYLKSR